MDISFIQPILDQGAALILAIVMIVIMRSWHEDSVKRAEARATEAKRDHELEIQRLQATNEEHKQDKQMLAEIVKANTEGYTKLIGALERIETWIQERVNGTPK